MHPSHSSIWRERHSRGGFVSGCARHPYLSSDQSFRCSQVCQTCRESARNPSAIMHRLDLRLFDGLEPNTAAKQLETSVKLTFGGKHTPGACKRVHLKYSNLIFKAMADVVGIAGQPVLSLATVKAFLGNNNETFQRAVDTMPKLSDVTHLGDTISATCTGTVQVGVGKQKTTPHYCVTAVLAATPDKKKLWVCKSRCSCIRQEAGCKHTGALLCKHIGYSKSEEGDAESADTHEEGSASPMEDGALLETYLITFEHPDTGETASTSMCHSTAALQQRAPLRRRHHNVATAVPCCPRRRRPDTPRRCSNARCRRAGTTTSPQSSCAALVAGDTPRRCSNARRRRAGTTTSPRPSRAALVVGDTPRRCGNVRRRRAGTTTSPRPSRAGLVVGDTPRRCSNARRRRAGTTTSPRSSCAALVVGDMPWRCSNARRRRAGTTTSSRPSRAARVVSDTPRCCSNALCAAPMRKS